MILSRYHVLYTCKKLLNRMRKLPFQPHRDVGDTKLAVCVKVVLSSCLTQAHTVCKVTVQKYMTDTLGIDMKLNWS